jgi:hypothetical protein
VVVLYLFGRASIPKELHDYSNYSDGEYFFPNENELAMYKIIVCTLINSGR